MENIPLRQPFQLLVRKRYKLPFRIFPIPGDLMPGVLLNPHTTATPSTTLE